MRLSRLVLLAAAAFGMAAPAHAGPVAAVAARGRTVAPWLAGSPRERPGLPPATPARPSPSPSPAPSPAGPPPDYAPYNFEYSTQGWTPTGALVIGLATTPVHAYAGSSSLGIALQSQSQPAFGSVAAYGVDIPPGSAVTLHFWLPSNSGIASVQPYVVTIDASGHRPTTSRTYPAASLRADTWNTLLLTVPSDARRPVEQLGLEISAAPGIQTICYLDTVAW